MAMVQAVNEVAVCCSRLCRPYVIEQWWIFWRERHMHSSQFQ